MKFSSNAGIQPVQIETLGSLVCQVDSFVVDSGVGGFSQSKLNNVHLVELADKTPDGANKGLKVFQLLYMLPVLKKKSSEYQANIKKQNNSND